jgi:phosphatidate cytidylyltransferase
MIRALLAVTIPGFLLGAAGMALANRRVAPQVARQRWLKIGVFFAIVHAVLGFAVLGTMPLRWLFLALIGSCLVEFARAWRRVPPPRPARAWAVAVALALAAAAGTLRNNAGVLLWCFLVVACADGFAQVCGQLFGHHALAPRLSPAKTIEGALGGMAAAAVGSVALRSEAALSVAAALAWGLAVFAAALCGDLAASWLKRRAGIKDYSNVLPGQGGLLDRFDSLIGALALVAAFA